MFKADSITTTGNFFVELLTCEENEPLVSNITITVEENMNGDIIECAYNGVMGEIEVCTVNIPGNYIY